MEIKTVSTLRYVSGVYFGDIQINIINEYVVVDELETQLIELNITILNNGEIRADGAQIESRWKGKLTENNCFWITELRAKRFNYYTSLEEVKRQIALFGEKHD